MKIVGMIGGIGPESTIDYYRRLLEGAQKRNPGGPALQIIINSIDLQKGLDLLGRNQLNELTEYIVPEVMRLHSAGVDTSGIARTDEANTALAFVSLDAHGERSDNHR